MTTAAVLIAGTHSGCGKTTVSLGIMAALKRRGVAVQPFKCGPDFIDPSLHHLVTGKISRNLDVRMCGADYVGATFARNSRRAQCCVIEGVMGLFDGGEGSAAVLAKTLGLPVLLVVDVRSAAESIAAVVKGFAELDPAVRLAGIICNRVGSARHQQLIAGAIAAHCPVPILGFLPRQEEISIPSRHLGLHMGDEQPLSPATIDRLAQLMEDHLDLDQLLRIASTAQQEHGEVAEVSCNQLAAGKTVRLGVARDAAFCFYYEDNLDMLRQAGAELCQFSPLKDRDLPPELGGLYLGGGYPELYAQQLSDNESMRNQIRIFAESGRPVYAECGGFMYLCQAITTGDGQSFPMAGMYPLTATMQPRLRSLGYRQAVVEHDCLLAPQGQTLHGHEFHYSTVGEAPAAIDRVYLLDNGQREGFVHRNTLAGYVHLHWGRTPEVAGRFVQTCRQYTED